MQSLTVDHTNFDANRLLKTSPETKTTKPAIDPKKPEEGMKTQNYQIIPIQYEYDVPNPSDPTKIDKLVGPLCIQLPEIYTPLGITEDEKQDGCSLYCQYDIQKPEIQKFVSDDGPASKLYNTFFERVFAIRGHLGLAAISTKDGLRAVFKDPLLYFAKDKNTCEIIAGKNPTKFFKLLNNGKPGSFMRREALFTLPVIDPETGKHRVLPWSMLRGVEMKFIPLVHFPHIYIGGGKCVLKCEIISAVVTYIVQTNSISKQLHTAEVLSKDEILSKSIAQQFEALQIAHGGIKKKEEESKEKPLPVDTTLVTNTTTINKPLPGGAALLNNILSAAPTNTTITNPVSLTSLGGLSGLSGLTKLN